MQFYIVSTSEPEPMPTVSPLPDIGQVTDFSTAISGIVGTVLLLVIGLAWLKARSWIAEIILDVKATKSQTVNSHKTNLRDDLTSVIEKIDGLAAQQSAMHEDLRDTRRDVRFNIEYTRDVDKRLHEHTRDTKEEGRS